MSIFIDYYKTEGEIQFVSILADDDQFYDYYEPDFDGMTDYLFSPGFIVTFGLTRAPLERLIGDDPRLEDFALRYRWLDIQAEIRKKADVRPTLRNVLAGTVGEQEGKWTDIVRREFSDWSSDIAVNRIQNAHDRLRALKEIYDSALLNGEIHYYHREQYFLVDMEWIEPGHPLSIDHTAEGIERTRDY